MAESRTCFSSILDCHINRKQSLLKLEKGRVGQTFTLSLIRRKMDHMLMKQRKSVHNLRQL
ncbi:hypothetical protein Tsubulata_026767 [Turnera subulata]|uniref:Uncharacterized protein n=1 Tax=Turnera subulata TaxID=218843 RepID=A0A9Q0G6N0_9ROSI|nr:hypothetical protein Tsubulata_026767 [Turnera subulata]